MNDWALVSLLGESASCQVKGVWTPKPGIILSAVMVAVAKVDVARYMRAS